MNSKDLKKSLIQADIQKLETELKVSKIKNDCLIVKPVNQWINEARLRPIPSMLFSELWYEGELCILYADTNVGKSILAVQIGQSISAGIPINNFRLEAKAQRVLYLDFELSDKQFEKRYSKDYNNHFNFHPNFFRAEINPLVDIPKAYNGVEEFLCAQLTEIVKKNYADVIIIDNLTFLQNDNEKAKHALILMKQLKTITKELGVSVLVLAHTPKRDESKPISVNDLAGSKMLSNFCDSAFAIGKSTEKPNYRYIKQIKQRNTEHLYHSDNVLICALEKESNFLEFKFLYFDSEFNHLSQSSKVNLDERDNEMKRYISDGCNNTDVAKKLGLSEGAIRKRRKVLGI